MSITRRIALAAVTALAAPSLGRAQGAWPNRTIRLVVPFPPGGSTDVVGRLVAERLQAALGQNVVVENRGGASGAVGSAAVARMPADGYALVVSGVGSHGIVPAVVANPGYDALRDFTHVGMLGLFNSVLVVNPSFPAQDLAGFLAEARRRPGALNYATSGNGSSNHLLGEVLKSEAQVDITHVPYRGAGPALQAVLANEVPAMFDSLPSAAPQIAAGTLRPLAISARRRLPSLPNLPTFVEQGYPRVIVENWFGIAGPAGMPAEATERLSRVMAEILAQPVLIERFQAVGFAPEIMDPAATTAFVVENLAFWADAVKRAGITAN
jgi:tripartite-type tricarboxylate transporter receptor subunit TctC